MPFLLKRGAANIAAEVQRWQYFLLRQGIVQTGAIDAVFGIKTEEATRIFQVGQGLAATGELDKTTLTAADGLGYTVLPDDYYKKRSSGGFPAKPSGLDTPTNAQRNEDFTCFDFMQHPRPPRPDEEAIVILGSCDGALKDWTAANIVTIDAPQMRFVKGFGGKLRCHKVAAPIIKALLMKWEKDDLLHLLMTYDGTFVPRYKRGQAPHPKNGHGGKSSLATPALSNHAFGSAFDVNAGDNAFKTKPALCGERGSVRELVESANALGVYWGGHFSSPDGMHFEVSDIGAAEAIKKLDADFGAALTAVKLPTKPDPAITWFKSTFGAEIQAKIAGTPFSENMLAAIAMQETSYIWRKHYKTLPLAELLEICVGDTLDAPKRSAFPKTRAELEAETDGEKMFGVARAALEHVAKYNDDFAKVAKNPDKFCHGFGIFQYDLQFFKIVPKYFLDGDWKIFANALDKCVLELTAKCKKVYGPGKTSLTHDESVYVAIAYNKGSVDLKKGFKQGYKDASGVYYGEHIDRYLSAAEVS